MELIQEVSSKLNYEIDGTMILESNGLISELFLIQEILVTGSFEGVEITPYKIKSRHKMSLIDTFNILTGENLISLGLNKINDEAKLLHIRQ